MGNRIKTLAEIEMGGKKFDVELNGGTKKEKFDIHIQNKEINICMKDYEYAQFVTSVLVANKRMKRFKKENEQSGSI